MKTKMKTKIKRLKGFTLIELLVVIAIIGILASVLLVNLSGTRNKAKDSAIKLEMNQIRTAVESFALSNATYVGACADGTTDCDTLQDDITGKQGGTLGTAPTFTTSNWCVSVTLNDATFWCVDATGYAGAPTASTTCNTT
ncbi:MAG: type II secretion system protein, partial [Candidatus Staskawiczbacteria bacterium]|nr:type II secretion system protein [Candidatus Staskawiczbacteria bacterium]